ncbi:spore germination protein [Paenibacillus sp. UNC451MF]|uniref:spore germination protein n=1 Tax=Paenibacillus sp. UNC451MF TaxID=1449063 RepID=UPI00048B1C67|nr:spore germination protein [Paenibacillus sp. UNC451MF]
MNKNGSQAPLWNLQKLKKLFVNSSDVQLQEHRFAEIESSEILLIYAEGLCDSKQIGKDILPDLKKVYDSSGFGQYNSEQYFGTLPLIPLPDDSSEDFIVESVFQGDLLLFFPQTNSLFKMNICNLPGRTPQESSTEISIKGPKDGFTEEIVTNIALIRKRIRSNSLCYETTIIGRRTRTKVGLLFIDDIISPQVLGEIRKRLKKVDIDGLYSIGQLEELLGDVKYSLFPLIDFTGRPDYAVAALLAGRFVLIVDGNPFALIAPAGFSLILKSPEDIHFNFQYVSFARLIRLASFWLSGFLPGFWVSIAAFHQDQIPFRLMATIAVARLGLPFTAQIEMLLLLLLLEIFREAGVRLPSSIGQTLTVVGGLIIGDASIRAGLVSPSVVVVGAITAVSGVTLVNQTLSTVLSVIRLSVFIICSILGLYGLILSIILLVFYMSKLQSFGVPYLSPLSPPIPKDILKSFLRGPWSKMRSRPRVLNTMDSDHQGEDKS